MKIILMKTPEQSGNLILENNAKIVALQTLLYCDEIGYAYLRQKGQRIAAIIGCEFEEELG